jgi:hypothetical protein
MERVIFGYEISVQNLKRKPRLVGVMVDDPFPHATTQQIREFLEDAEDIEFARKVVANNEKHGKAVQKMSR